DRSDVDLIARAFRRWGDDAPAHILGDFAVAVWDSNARRLVLARDRFGVRPLYFARAGGSLRVSTALLPDDQLDDDAIFDFLLFGENLDGSKTTFARVGRVPPAHVAVFDASGMRQRRYWSVPVADAPRRISERDAVE